MVRVVLYGFYNFVSYCKERGEIEVFENTILTKILSRVWVTVDGVWIDDWIY
jgi:hypothetical protein